MQGGILWLVERGRVNKVGAKAPTLFCRNETAGVGSNFGNF